MPYVNIKLTRETQPITAEQKAAIKLDKEEKEITIFFFN